MVGEVYINGKDAQTEYGVIFGEDSFTALLTPAPVKSYITNGSALIHGKQVLVNDDVHPKLSDRDVQLTFYLKARNLQEFLNRYSKFTQMLQNGRVDIRTKYQPTVTYRCNYVSCAQFTQFNGRLAKFVLKLNESDPNDRATV